jgi:Methyltransferase domain
MEKHLTKRSEKSYDSALTNCLAGSAASHSITTKVLRMQTLNVADRPSFDCPVSQLVSAEQIFSPRFQQWCRVFGMSPALNRKIWEYLYILNAMDQFAGLRPGRRARGFGVGRERIVPLLASFGCEVVATDYFEKRELWPLMAQNLDDLFDPRICSEATFRSLVAFRNVDMNHIPPDLRDFDCLWSCGSLEHIGGLQNGLDFIEATMECLRPGGIAVHTTEFNVVSDEITYETPNMCFYRRRDIVALAERLRAKGHQIVLNFTRGDTPADSHVDLVPEGNHTLSLTVQCGAYIITSIGIIVQKNLDAVSSATPPSNTEQQTVIEAASLWLTPSFTEILRSDGVVSYNAVEHGSVADKTIFYGPYTMLPSGTYQVAIGREIVGTFKVRLTGAYGRIVLHEQAISSVNDLIVFTTTTPVAQFEVVLLRTDTSERLSVDRIVLTRR